MDVVVIQSAIYWYYFMFSADEFTAHVRQPRPALLQLAMPRRYLYDLTDHIFEI